MRLAILLALVFSQVMRHRFKLALLGTATAGLLMHEHILLFLGRQDELTGALLGVAYSAPPKRPAHSRALVELHVRCDQTLAQLSEPVLGFAIDTSQVVGGHWWSKDGHVEVGRGAERTSDFDFERPRLRRLARALAPARLRIGGTEADHVFYAQHAGSRLSMPEGYELVFTRSHWKHLTDFVRDVGYSLMFTINAGPGPRDSKGAWQPDNAKRLLDFARDDSVDGVVWELGNEVNAYWFIHGLSHHVDGERYAADFRRFRSLVKSRFPGARVAGPAGFLWPVVGEPLEQFTGVFDDFLRLAGSEADIVTWHYYPQQSRRCPMATRRAGPSTLLHPGFLDETDHWAGHLEALVARHAPRAELWMGESGNAQCGGEPGVSDRFASSLWYLDQLGMLARRGQPMIRQTLVGSHYGLMDPETLEPWPDYWAALAYRRLMTGRVLEVRRSSANPYLRSYASCTPPSSGHRPGSVTLLLINLDESLPARFRLDTPIAMYHFTAPSLQSVEVSLNGHKLAPTGSGATLLGWEEPDRARFRALAIREGERAELAPRSYAFAIVEAAAPACVEPEFHPPNALRVVH